MFTKNINTIILFSLILFAGIQAKYQNFQMPKHYAGKKHRGFYISFSPSINYNKVRVDSKNYGYSTFEGFGNGMNLKIGGTLIENLVLHAKIIGHGVNGPKIESDDWGINDIKLDNKVSLSEMMFGVGVTYYNYYNYLFSTSFGIGSFTLENEREDIDFTTDGGFSFQLKVGKEWWVFPKFALGVAAFYHHTNCLNQKGNDAEEKIKSNNFGVVLNLTRHGRK